MRRAVLLALIAATLVPSAAGAGPVPVDGRLSFDGLRIEGAAEASSPEGVLDLTVLAQAGRMPEVAWSAARGWSVHAAWTEARAGDVSLKESAEPRNASLRGGAGRLVSLQCGPGCVVALVGLGGEGTRVGAAGTLAGPLAWLDRPAVYWSQFSEPGKADAFSLTLPPGTFAVQPANATLRAEGRVGLFAHGVAATLEQDGRTRVVDVRVRREATGDPLGAAAVTKAASGFLWLDLEGARLDAPGDAPLLFRAGELRVEGALDAAGATGHLDAGRTRVQLQGDALRMACACRLA
ncbi:MAG TPA: hypothetical protein VNX21_00485, partial [Candidatus Thermoplasmatota archaeon]|nr:hypothetical protein [Candidatus Thermoplasmatota archaeon]